MAIYIRLTCVKRRASLRAQQRLAGVLGRVVGSDSLAFEPGKPEEPDKILKPNPVETGSDENWPIKRYQALLLIVSENAGYYSLESISKTY